MGDPRMTAARAALRAEEQAARVTPKLLGNVLPSRYAVRENVLYVAIRLRAEGRLRGPQPILNAWHGETWLRPVLLDGEHYSVYAKMRMSARGIVRAAAALRAMRVGV